MSAVLDHSVIETPEGQLARLTTLARRAIELYHLPSTTRVKLLNLSENATFLLHDEASGLKQVLRVNRPGYHSEAAILSELKWLDALRNHPEIVTAQPVPGANGKLIQVLEHRAVPEARHAVLFSFLPGTEPDPKDHASFEQLGAVTAHLHNHSRNWPEVATLVRHTWDLETMFFGEKTLWGRWQDGVGVQGERAVLLERLAAYLQDRINAFGKSSEHFGLIHADLRLANLLLHEGKVQVIDFDDCGFSWYIYDLASALSFIEDQPQVPALIEAWIRGYEKFAPLTRAAREEIPTFIMARRLLLTAWVGSHQESPYPRQLGEGFTVGTCRLAEKFLAQRGAL